MLNYSNLNDMEFEALCQDIMTRRLGVQLRRFAPGRDGGVDLTDDAAHHNIVVQVKHYTGTSTSGLIRTLKAELSKVEVLKPKQYYICCSKQLSDPSIKGLYQHFAAYMNSSWNIVTLNEIDDFLKKPENHDILKKHFKLWMDDIRILQMSLSPFSNQEPLNSEEKFSKRELYAYSVKEKMFDLVGQLLSHMIRLQSGSLDNHELAFTNFYLLAGDLQVSFLDYKEYMRSYEEEHKDFFMVSELQKIIDTVTMMGYAMIASSSDENQIGVFAFLYNEVMAICQTVRKAYIQSMGSH